MISRVGLWVAVAAAGVAWTGLQEWYVSRGTTPIPAAVDLAAVESGTVPANVHWTVGEHVAVCEAGVYAYRRSGTSSAPDPDSTVGHFYCPIVSVHHPFVTALERLARKHGSLAAVPAREVPELRDVAVVVKTDKYRQVRDLPRGITRVSNVRGMIVNRIGSLSAREGQLLAEAMPRVSVRKLLILQEGRVPAARNTLLGGALTVGVLGLLFLGLRRA